MSSRADQKLPPLIRALLRSDAYDHPVSRVELVETHISWVILTGRYAYKIKKPIDLGFVDFSTLERRQLCCQEEIRLNRRLAPKIYIGVVSIIGSAESPRISPNGNKPIEYAVKMVQFSRAGELDKMVERGELAQCHIEAFARLIARFHESIDRPSADSGYGNSEQVSQPVEENFKQIRQRVSETECLVKLDQLEKWSRDQFQRLEPLFESRKEDGYVRECHGDLHLANMAWIEGEPLVFDCIEFNPSLRWIDVLSEIAFLTIDLEERGQAELAYLFLNAYLELSGDYAGLPVLNFYFAYRLMVRAKVEAIRAHQQPRDSELRIDGEKSFRMYLELAVGHTQPKKPLLLITCGLSGSGKSSLTQSLLGPLRAIRIRSDVERKRLYGLPTEEAGERKSNLDLYGNKATKRTYEKLVELAERGLDSGFTIIVDATCLKAGQRKLFQTLAAKKQAPYSILNATASEKELRRRLENRRNGVSDAGVTVMQEQLSAFEAFSDTETPHLIQVDTGLEIDTNALVERIEVFASIPAEHKHGNSS
jgi:aminoglycoside phosphotransferase family enzyme/predicted kinase